MAVLIHSLVIFLCIVSGTSAAAAAAAATETATTKAAAEAIVQTQDHSWESVKVDSNGRIVHSSESVKVNSLAPSADLTKKQMPADSKLQREHLTGPWMARTGKQKVKEFEMPVLGDGNAHRRNPANHMARTKASKVDNPLEPRGTADKDSPILAHSSLTKVAMHVQDDGTVNQMARKRTTEIMGTKPDSRDFAIGDEPNRGSQNGIMEKPGPIQTKRQPARPPTMARTGKQSDMMEVMAGADANHTTDVRTQANPCADCVYDGGVGPCSLTMQFGDPSPGACITSDGSHFCFLPGTSWSGPVSSCEGSPVDCVMYNWYGWSSCSATCGQGSQSRSRSVHTYAANGGSPCGNEHESTACNLGDCPVHCIVNDWEPWSSCDKTCGQGTQTRSRTVQTAAANNGDACPTLTEDQACHTNDCPVDCVVHDWGSWTACDKTCGSGTQGRDRTVEVAPANGGAACPDLDETQACNTNACPTPVPTEAPTAAPTAAPTYSAADPTHTDMEGMTTIIGKIYSTIFTTIVAESI